ncbi:hypothetical protein KFK09_012139 [Dendrobium nobile]|uniref:rRNA-processing protein EFG1 n=1 Tax=Dendrobium nobile TaxID=94219 RepID=A0A8T3BEH0_DENNO|nr:hypothetical protein KFK09_012139 [Dendrobium nobile]
MAHGGFAQSRVEERRQLGCRPKGLGVDKKKKKKKDSISLKNQIRSTERFLRKDLPREIRLFQQQKLVELKKQQETKAQLAVQRKILLRDKKIKFFERRKVERMIRRLEKQQRVLSEKASEERVSDQLAKFREDLEYIRFFPKTERYVSLFVGGENPKIIDKRNKLRKQIKDNLVAAAASGKDLEETGSDDDVQDMSEDDFFSVGSSSDEVEADDEWTDKSTRETTSCASGKATSSMSSDERNQRSISERILSRPPHSLPPSRFRSEEKTRLSTFSSAPHKRSRTIHRGHRLLNADQTSNLSSNSDVHKARRKRRPKKKKQISLS